MGGWGYAARFGGLAASTMPGSRGPSMLGIILGHAGCFAAHSAVLRPSLDKCVTHPCWLCVHPRRQELVFIGIDLDQQALSTALNACLVTAAEARALAGAAGAAALPDPFAAWPPLEELLHDDEADAEGQEDTEGDSELDSDGDEEVAAGSEEEEAAAEETALGTVLDMEDGASEVQAALDGLPEGATAIVHWYAPWCVPSREADDALRRLAASYPNVAFFHIDVEVTAANWFLAKEKVRPALPCPGFCSAAGSTGTPCCCT